MLPGVDAGFGGIYCQLISYKRIFSSDAKNSAVSDDAVHATVSSAGRYDNHFPFGFSQPAVALHERIVVSHESP